MLRRLPTKHAHIGVFMSLLISALVLLAGCGVTSTPHGGTDDAALPTATSGAVILATSSRLYAAHDTVSVTITNNGNQPIFAADHQTNCTVIQLQRLTNSTWSDVHKCSVLTATVVHQFDAHRSSTIQLVGSPQNWPAGTFRAVFHFGDSQVTSATQVAYSAAFQVA